MNGKEKINENEGSRNLTKRKRKKRTQIGGGGLNRETIE